MLTGKNMGPTDWLDQIEITASCCDAQGLTTYMNRRGSESFAKDGGYALIGQSMVDCHPAGPVREKFIKLLEGQKLNCYTVEKQGQKKLIYQAPLFKDGAFQGYVELSLPIPETMPHFVRG
jgi:hypothetical protein